jgi:hypothetical protein
MTRLRQLAFGLIIITCLGTACKRGEVNSSASDDGGSVPEELAVFSLDERDYKKQTDDASKDAERFNGYRILGKTAVSDAKSKKEVVAALKTDIEKPEEQAKCFWPRHGVRVVDAGKTTDYLICFECHGYEEIRSGKPRDDGLPQAFGHSSEAILNDLLEKASVPQHPRRF